MTWYFSPVAVVVISPAGAFGAAGVEGVEALEASLGATAGSSF